MDGDVEAALRVMRGALAGCRVGVARRLRRKGNRAYVRGVREGRGVGAGAHDSATHEASVFPFLAAGRPVPKLHLWWDTGEKAMAAELEDAVFVAALRHSDEALFHELDADGDGYFTVADARRALSVRGLPMRHAGALVRQCTAPRWGVLGFLPGLGLRVGRGVTLSEFRAYLQGKEATLQRIFREIDENQNGVLDVGEVRRSLERAGVPLLRERDGWEESDETEVRRRVDRMMQRVSSLSNTTTGTSSSMEGEVSYLDFRHYAMLLPVERTRFVDLAVLESGRPGSSLYSEWYDSALTEWTTGAVLVPGGGAGFELDGGRADAAKSAGVNRSKETSRELLLSLAAGALSAGTSTSITHPLDTVKTQLQAGTEMPRILENWRGLGAVRAVQTLYRGSVPAIAGITLGNGLRTSVTEAILLMGIPGLARVQAQALASAVGTTVGTCFRVPCETLKQRLQVGHSSNVAQAFLAASRERPGGVLTLWRGTAVTMMREVPLFVVGTIAYERAKTLAMFVLGRDSLRAPEILFCGAVAGIIAAVATTPADVLKTRIMTSAVPGGTTVSKIARDILVSDGPSGFFRGALLRSAWIAPVGMVNFAAYELAKGAMRESTTQNFEVQ